MRKLLNAPFLIKWLHWEYWSFTMLYGPIYLYWFVLCVRARSFFFFNTANPTIKNGGFLMESKKGIYDLLPEPYYPRTLLFSVGAPVQELVTQIRAAGFVFPLIAKPDIGMRGLAVSKLANEKEAVLYAQDSLVDFLVQEYVSYENEIGIFYYRYPEETTGDISGIVKKEFLTVTGDGKTPTRELLQRNPRYILQLPMLEQTLPELLSEVVPADEKKILVPYGNHARGALFLDYSDRVDAKLVSMIDEICQQVPGFYFGRLDIRYRNWEELKEGKHFSIIELNGAGSEPTHMYDPRHSVFFAWKEIIRHWHILLRISIQNHRRLHLPYLSTAAGLQMFRENAAYVKKIQPVSKA
jgi:hypothetical protein